MANKLSKKQWCEILENSALTNAFDLAMFQALYSFNDHKAYASQIGLLLGKKGRSPHAPLNLEIGRYAKRIAKLYDIQFTERSSKKYKYWDVFFEGWYEGRFFVWQLKPELASALLSCHLTDEQPYAEELVFDNDTEFYEGAKKTIVVNSYERNSKARKQCIAYWGCQCSVCNFDFFKTYGEIGANFIHVHHLVPVWSIGKTYQVDPVNDLRPVCPNCHAMLHTSEPPLAIEQLKAILQANTANS
ncbi:MAG: HNH endonuclease [Thiolinea sp.]